MANGTERRTSRRFTMTLPLTVVLPGPDGAIQKKGHTRDVSFKGLYFLTEADFQTGADVEFILTLPREITMAGDVNIHCHGQIVRVEPQNAERGVAARINRYEFLPVAG